MASGWNREEMPATLSENVRRSTCYSFRPPSPPYILVPPEDRLDMTDSAVVLTSSFKNKDPTQLTLADLQNITGNCAQLAKCDLEWNYNMRQCAQPILDYLYLGPTKVIRDLDFLRKKGITLLLVIRSAGLSSTKLLSVEKATSVEALNLSARYIDFDGTNQMVATFPEIVRLVNDHLLSVYHSQARGRSENGQLIMPSEIRYGKVLVACESGNDRSATVAAAYIMAALGETMVQTVQDMNRNRFSCIFDEDMKGMLLTWEGILRARSEVAHSGCLGMDVQQSDGTRTKRGCEEMMDAEENGAETGQRRFIPFIDAGTDLGGGEGAWR